MSNIHIEQSDIVDLRFTKVETTLEELVCWALAQGVIEEVAYLMSAQHLVREAKRYYEGKG